MIDYDVYRERTTCYNDDQVVSLGEWVLWLAIVTIVPIYGIIHVFITAFGKDKKESMRNFARAYLIYAGILIVVSIFMAIPIINTVLDTVQWVL